MIDPASGSGFTGQSAQIHLGKEQNLGIFGRAVGARVFVSETGAGGSVVLRVGAERIFATSTVPLRKGEWYFVRIERRSGQVTLRVDSQIARGLMAGEVARSAGLPADAVAEAVVRAFVRTELPLTPDRLMKAYRRVLPSGRKDSGKLGESARIAAIAEKKGLVLESEILDAIGEFGGHGQAGGNRRGPGEHHAPAGQDENGDGPVISAEGVRSAFRLSVDANHPLQLFNHLLGEGDHWVIVPIEAPGTGLQASLRLLIPRAFATGIDRTTPSVREGVLVVENGDERWVFGVLPGGVGIRAVLLSGPPLGSEAAHLKVLAERLRTMGIDCDWDTPSVSDDDGFSQRNTGDIMTTVDSSV